MASTNHSSPDIRPFTISVDDETLDWINQRVKTARIALDVKQAKGEEWKDGTPSDVLEDLRDYWVNQYDWRRVEAKLNGTWKMFTVDLDEEDETINLHFAHHRSERKDAIPLLFAHGWPGNFTEAECLLSLVNPADQSKQAFHIIAPTLPGFVFSSSPKGPGFSPARMARLYHKLMLALGYKHYVAQGGDWGSLVLRSLALQFPGACVGLHLNFLTALAPSVLTHPGAMFRLVVGWMSAEEQKRFNRFMWYMSKSEQGYVAIQSTKPQTLSHGLNDSPIGMLSWIREKFNMLSEDDFLWDKELVITWTMLYLLSNSSGHARIYKTGIDTVVQDLLSYRIPAQVAVGYSSYPKDVGFSTQWWARASVCDNITFWKIHDKGGHFASIDSSERFLEDILAFVQTISPEKRKLLL